MGECGIDTPADVSGTNKGCKSTQLYLLDGDVLPFAGGLDRHLTLGHTPGRISLYHAKSRALIIGDALVSKDGFLIGPNEHFTMDLEQAWQSIERFATFDVQTEVCYHGGIRHKDVNEQFARLAHR